MERDLADLRKEINNISKDSQRKNNKNKNKNKNMNKLQNKSQYLNFQCALSTIDMREV